MRIFLSITFFLLQSFAFCQNKFSFGFSGMHNFPLQTTGVGFRTQIEIVNKLYVVPQVKYSPSFNQVHEVFAGLNFHYFLLNNYVFQGRNLKFVNRPALYLSGGVEYNRWINYQLTVNPRANTNNILPEVGGGILFGSSTTQFFIEGKYNPLWNESYTEIGFQIYPYFIRQNKKNNCPKIY